jgi:hypothetical protein
MKTLKVSLEDRSYPIWIGSGIVGDSTLWQQALAPGRPFVFETGGGDY